MTTEEEKELRGKLQRYRDIVRYYRSEAFNDNLIDEEEYADLLSDGASSVGRLESYDQLRKKFNDIKSKVDLIPELLNTNSTLEKTIATQSKENKDLQLKIADLQYRLILKHTSEKSMRLLKNLLLDRSFDNYHCAKEFLIENNMLDDDCLDGEEGETE